MKRRITVLALAMVLVLALSTFTRAANYVGLGIGIVGQAADYGLPDLTSAPWRWILMSSTS